MTSWRCRLPGFAHSTLRRSRGRGRALVAAGTAVLAVLATAGVGAGPARAAEPPPTTLDPAEVDESLTYLMETYGVSEAEALRRLELQSAGDRLTEALEQNRPDSYGGMALDQEAGGVLVLSMTDPDAAAPFLGEVTERGTVQTRQVRWSLKHLREVADRLRQRLGTGPNSIYLPAVDATANKVVLWERTWVTEAKRAGNWSLISTGDPDVPTTPAQRAESVRQELAAAEEATVAEGDVVGYGQLDEPAESYKPKVDKGYCHPVYCSTKYGPMRGGLRLDIKRDNGTWGGCTSGFNMRSLGGAFNHWAWVVTAGHCVIGKKNNTAIQHNGYNVFGRHRPFEINSFPYDFAILPYLDAAHSQAWLDNFSGRNRVMKFCRNGGLDSDADTPCGRQAKPVNEYLTKMHPFERIRKGWVVCASGTGTREGKGDYPNSHDSGAGAGYRVGTRCGRVMSDGDIFIDTDLCARKGDSGGPLFSQIDHSAYGILRGGRNGQDRSGPCQRGERNIYSPLSAIVDWINGSYVRQGSLFNPILASQG